VETRRQGHDHNAEEKMKTRKHKVHEQTEQPSPTKKTKQEKENEDGKTNGKTVVSDNKEYDDFCKLTRDHLSPHQIKEILKLNGQDPSGSDAPSFPDGIQDLLYYGALLECEVCGGNLEFIGKSYACTGEISEWASCTYKTRNPPRKQDPIKLPDSVLNSPVSDLLKKYQDPSQRHQKEIPHAYKPFTGMVICISGRLLELMYQYWKKEIEKHGGKVANTAIGVTCLVVSPMERERGGSSKVSEAIERGIPVVREAWLLDTIEKQELQPLEAYDCVSDRSAYGKGIAWDKQDPSEEAIESLTAEQQGGKILEKDGLLYNCGFSLCDQGRGRNEIAITQLITVPDQQLYLYYKKGKVGDDPKAEERQEVFIHVIFLQDDGVEVRYGGLAVRQLGAAAAHSKLDPVTANFMKILCSQEIYRYALMEMGLDSPDMPAGMAAAHLESLRDINVASRLIGDMSGSTLDDPLAERYKKLGCKITALDKESDDYKMILNYLEKTYEPIKVGEIAYDVSVDNILAVELNAGPSYGDIKKLPNKVLLWCGKKILIPFSHVLITSKFGRAIVCSDASAEAARYGFTAIDRPEGFLVLAVASLGDKIVEDDIKVPCGKLVPTSPEPKDSILDFNEYAVYDPNQVKISFLVAVKYIEKDVVMDVAE
ncbi:Poly [ADP-ribose] polymerase 3, partial [Bienertia sinuspersici]